MLDWDSDTSELTLEDTDSEFSFLLIIVSLLSLGTSGGSEELKDIEMVIVVPVHVLVVMWSVENDGSSSSDGKFLPSSLYKS